MHIPVRIVLVETSHPGNIGASARAMETMGLKDLVLVRPKVFPSADATVRASGADEVLRSARVVDSFAEAIGDCGFVVGSSARLRGLAWPTIDPRTCARSIWEHLSSNQVAIVMGPEHSGLTNEYLGRCQRLVHIPTNPAYSSLNLAMAVQVLCYELRLAHPQHEPLEGRHDERLASAEELESFHKHLEDVLCNVGFLRAGQSRQLKLRLRKIFHRAMPDENEINILRGILSALDPRKKSK